MKIATKGGGLSQVPVAQMQFVEPSRSWLPAKRLSDVEGRIAKVHRQAQLAVILKLPNTDVRGVAENDFAMICLFMR